MILLRKYGRGPYKTAVIHGGPGAPGEMAPVARELSAERGVLEPLQTADSLEGQVEELKKVLEGYGAPPMVLTGFSWGAWLGFILAAYYPELASKLILVGSGPFEEKYSARILETRLKRLAAGEREEVSSIMTAAESGMMGSYSFNRLGELMNKADSYDPLPGDEEEMEPSPEIYRKVWEEASRLRRSGELLELGARVRCPVVAIHGDYDPHPFEGVKTPLSGVVRDFRFILLERCGHYPWLERQACGDFYRVLRKEIGNRVEGRGLREQEEKNQETTTN
ncbi:MAG: alpha/beta hydrolase [Dehalococcoidales bacterium]|nr:alpha/beta hydrolase [Dehalococcoidales bacterium]